MKDSMPTVHFATSSFNLSSLKSIKATSMACSWNLNLKKPIFKFCRKCIFYIVLLFFIETLGIDINSLFIVSFSNNSSITSKPKLDNCIIFPISVVLFILHHRIAQTFKIGETFLYNFLQSCSVNVVLFWVTHNPNKNLELQTRKAAYVVILIVSHPEWSDNLCQLGFLMGDAITLLGQFLSSHSPRNILKSLIKLRFSGFSLASFASFYYFHECKQEKDQY